MFGEKESNKIIIDYNRINIALNRNEINNFEDLKKYIKICNKDNIILKNQDNCNSKMIKKCATYQMRARLEGKNGELDDESRMAGGRTGLQSIIVLAELVDDINALKRVRFEVGQDNSCWPVNTYKNKELFLNYLGITANNLSRNYKLIPINVLLENGISYISINMITTTRGHEVSSMIDLEKAIKGEEDFIYTYDTARSIDNIDKDGDLGGLQNNCRIFSHIQQRLGSCWYHAACSTITTAKYPKIFEKIRNNKIKPVKKPRIEENKPNEFETLQISMMQKVAEDLEVKKLGKTLDEKGNRPKMVHQIVNQDFIGIVKDVLKI